MTGSTLAALAASLLSLLFSYIPGFKTWYSPLDPYTRRLAKDHHLGIIMLAFVIAVTIGAFSFVCAGLADGFSIKITCDTFDACGLVLCTVTANQAAL
jgi:hypothetical protein